MNIIKSIPVLAFLAVVLAGCDKQPPAEAMCETLASCGQLDGQTAKECTTGADQALSLFRTNASCVALADKFEREMECASNISCEDIEKLELGSSVIVTDLPQGTACREEIIAVVEEMDSGRCRLDAAEAPEPEAERQSKDQ